MDSLMCGVGVGFSTHTTRLSGLQAPATNGSSPAFVIPDSREGWVDSVRALIDSYSEDGHEVHFDYSQIRPAGIPLKGFGGISSGPGPLIKVHERIRSYLDAYVQGRTSQTRLVVDVMNAIGACVVAGNIRRSAEIALGSPLDTEFLNLKNYNLNPEREEIGWMSNNTVVLTDREHFSALPQVAELVTDRGEPGILNMLNARKYGRIGDRMEDNVTGVNPCGEILLESYELCNLVEVLPTRCVDDAEIYQAMKLATFYASTVSLLRSHSPETNEVVSRNRRIGVSISGVADWIDSTSISHVFDVLNVGYEQVVRPTNTALAKDAGVPPSIRVTTVKPSGTISLLAGVSAGMHHPLDGYVLRRMRISQESPVGTILKQAGVPFEQDVDSDNTEVFEFPLRYGNGKTRSVHSVSIYEQAAVVAMLQKAWADNAVSNTLTVQPHELDQVERVLALFAPQVKSMSLLPDKPAGTHPQMPLEKITKHEFTERSKVIQNPDWSALTGQDGVDSRFCTNDFCEIP
jgi:ribonucleoside-diphosphate reductase alpha chain